MRVDDESESLIESLEDLQDAFKQDHHVCIEVGKLPYSIGLNYLRNLQELSVEAVEYLKRFFGIEEKLKYDFKPFDKVLVRKEGNKKWNISLFAREIVDDYNGLPYKYECSNGTLWDYCIHFEGNECLLGTTENPEK